MIAKEFERFLLAQEETFLTPAKNLAVLIDNHNVDHAVLLLSQISYSRIPVVTDERKFVGTISLTAVSYTHLHAIESLRRSIQSQDTSIHARQSFPYPYLETGSRRTFGTS